MLNLGLIILVVISLIAAKSAIAEKMKKEDLIISKKDGQLHKLDSYLNLVFIVGIFSAVFVVVNYLNS